MKESTKKRSSWH